MDPPVKPSGPWGHQRDGVEMDSPVKPANDRLGVSGIR